MNIRNLKYKLLSVGMSSKFRMSLTMLALLTYLVTPAMAAAQPNNVICAIITLYQDVAAAIFVIGLMLMILGGALYAGAHLMPSQQRGSLQGYGMGMVLGGVIGIIIAVIAPFILQVISGNSVSDVLQAANGVANGC
jgi:hypothetical protein